jgi:hypothetical protein
MVSGGEILSAQYEYVPVLVLDYVLCISRLDSKQPKYGWIRDLSDDKAKHLCEKAGNCAKSILKASYFLGAVLGCLLAGPVCDIEERLKILLLSVGLNALFNCPLSITTTPYNIIICRTMSGIGSGAIMACISSLVSKHSPSKQRGKSTNNQTYVTRLHLFSCLLCLEILCALLFLFICKNRQLYQSD